VSANLRLFNTLTRQTETFVPLKPGQVGMYTCGPTVYSYAHIGNMRTYIFADTLRRVIELAGYKLTHVMNITDVGHLTDDADAGDDKLEVGARREGLTAWDVAKKYTDAFFDHAGKLNIKRAHIVCKATDHIPEQIAMVHDLEKRGFTYVTDDGVYFDTSRFPAYGKFARLDIEGLQQGHRVEAGAKRQKTDFALWKFSKPEEKRAMEWDSPWGRGFPGWHIECSSMASKFLGQTFDIHTGGVDHIPIHHTNEIAQSECATGQHPFVRFWLHGEFLVIEDAAKMSKSLGNFTTVDTLVEKGFDPLAYRLLCLQSHYRKQLKFSYDNLLAAQKSYERLHQTTLGLKRAGAPATLLGKKAEGYRHEMTEAAYNDLNMPQVTAALFTLLDDAALAPAEKLALSGFADSLLGLDLLAERQVKTDDVPADLLALLKLRNDSRAAKDWAEADRCRAAIAARGYEILDSPQGSTLKRRL
jgi:cysteinyl-tRNA synthetase